MRVKSILLDLYDKPLDHRKNIYSNHYISKKLKKGDWCRFYGDKIIKVKTKPNDFDILNQEVGQWDGNKIIYGKN